MAIIDRIARGSIRNIGDMVDAIYLVLQDTFRDVGSCEGRGRRDIPFVVNDDHIDLGFQIVVLDYDDQLASITGDERHILDAARRLGLSPERAVYRLCFPPGDNSEVGLTMEDAWTELEHRTYRRPPGTEPAADHRDAGQPDGDAESDDDQVDDAEPVALRVGVAAE